MYSFKNANRIVIKVGTSTLTYSTGLIHIRRLEKLVKVMSDLINSGKQIILVTSGAIGVGCGKVGLRERPRDTPTKQAAAAIGQSELMHLYDTCFNIYNHVVAQVLMTKDIIENKLRRQNAVNTFDRLLALGAVPIVNENDTISTEEIEFGDNDKLSAIVACLVEADALIIISDIDGLYDDNPQINPNAKIIPVVEKIDDYIYSIAGGSKNKHGTGGMITKIHAAEIVTEAGIDMAIVNGEDPDILYDLMDGIVVGTHFVAQKSE